MPHLAGPRRGWENKHLAAVLLSRISFIARPYTVGDDIGSDFFCTLFDVSPRGAKEMLFARNSFAIQVKSRRDRSFPFSNKIDYLTKLELPFFLGIVDRNKMRLSIYSGEYLPFLFAEHGTPAALQLVPLSAKGIAKASYYEKRAGHRIRLRLPFVLHLNLHDDLKTLAAKGKELRTLCSRVHENISARTSCEYIFKLSQSSGVVIMAGPGSARTFRTNFCLRLAEAFYNLHWIRRSRPRQFKMREFLLYEQCYKGLMAQGSEIPRVLRRMYKLLKADLAQTQQPPLS